jgi:hypothetical protein
VQWYFSRVERTFYIGVIGGGEVIIIDTPSFWRGNFRFTDQREIRHWPQIEQQLEAILMGWA